MNELPDSHRYYEQEEEQPEKKFINFNRILDKIQQHPEVESVAVTFFDTYPGSVSGHMADHVNPQDTTKAVLVNRTFLDPRWDFFKVFRHTIHNGEKFISTHDFEMENPQDIVLTQLTADKLFPGESAVGKQMRTARGTYLYRIAGVVDNIKRFDYLRPVGYAFYPLRLDEKNVNEAQICIRIKDNVSSGSFANKFKRTMTKELRIGNFYLSDISSFTDINKNANYSKGITNTIRTRTILMLFILFSIMLCLLGIFWYRVNTRKEEIGIRRALGVTTGGIRQLFIWEGILLLVCILIPAMIIELQFVNVGMIETLGQSVETMGMYLPDKTIVRFLLTNLITSLLMTGIIIISIWYPATMACHITPEEALRDE